MMREDPDNESYSVETVDDYKDEDDLNGFIPDEEALEDEP